jgi:hypothetical protein
MVIDVYLKENELRFLKSSSITFHNKIPDKVELKIHHSQAWYHLYKQLIITPVLPIPSIEEEETGEIKLIDKDGVCLLDENGTIVVPQFGDKLSIDFENGSIVEIPKSVFTHPGIILHCEGKNKLEKPTFYISSNYLPIGVDKWCQL